MVLDPATAVASLTAAADVMATRTRVAERQAGHATLGQCLNLTSHTDPLARGEPSRLQFTD